MHCPHESIVPISSSWSGVEGSVGFAADEGGLAGLSVDVEVVVVEEVVVGVAEQGEVA